MNYKLVQTINSSIRLFLLCFLIGNIIINFSQNNYNENCREYFDVPNSANNLIFQDQLDHHIEAKAGFSYSDENIYQMSNKIENNASIDILAPNNPTMYNDFLNISVGDISASNHSVGINTLDKIGTHVLAMGQVDLISFKANTNCNITNVSFYLKREIGIQLKVDVLLFNSTWDSINKVSMPGGNPSNNEEYSTLIDAQSLTAGTGWVNFNFNENSPRILDNSKTQNNTWFIGLAIDTSSIAYSLNWYYEVDGLDSNNTLSYNYDGLVWQLYEDSGSGITIDYTSIVNLSTGETLELQNLNIRNKKVFSTMDFASIKVPSNVYLTNVSLYLNLTVALSLNLSIYIFNSTWNNQDKISMLGSEPGVVSSNQLLGTYSYGSGTSTEQWENFEFDINLDSAFLNNSKTENNTWFIGVKPEYVAAAAFWNYSTVGLSDKTISYYYNGVDTQLYEDSSSQKKVDFSLKYGLAPTNSSKVLPSNVGLCINLNAVSDNDDSLISGIFLTEKIIDLDNSGYLKLNCSATYWDVSWKIYSIISNYSKSYYISPYVNAKSKDIINWTLSTEINNYNQSFFDYRLIYFIPNSWNPWICYNETIFNLKSYTISNNNNENKSISIVNPNNSSNLVLKCYSNNYALGIGLYKDEVNSTLFYMFDILDIVAIFKEEIKGVINLSIYDISENLIFSENNITNLGNSKIYFSELNLSEIVENIGTLQIVFHWNNGTHFGIWNQEILIIPDNPIIIGNIQDNPNWTQFEDFGSFQIDLSTNESDNADSGSALKWYVTGLNNDIVRISNEYSDNDILIFESIKDKFGNTTFTLWLEDSENLTDSVSITLEIKPINDPPIIINRQELISLDKWVQFKNFGQIRINLSEFAFDVDNNLTNLYWTVGPINDSIIDFSFDSKESNILIVKSKFNKVGNQLFTLNLIDPYGEEDSIVINFKVLNASENGTLTIIVTILTIGAIAASLLLIIKTYNIRKKIGEIDNYDHKEEE